MSPVVVTRQDDADLTFKEGSDAMFSKPTRKPRSRKAAGHPRSPTPSLPTTAGCQPEKVLTVSYRPDCVADSNPVSSCESDG